MASTAAKRTAQEASLPFHLSIRFSFGYGDQTANIVFDGGANLRMALSNYAGSAESPRSRSRTQERPFPNAVSQSRSLLRQDRTDEIVRVLVFGFDLASWHCRSPCRRFRQHLASGHRTGEHSAGWSGPGCVPAFDRSAAERRRRTPECSQTNAAGHGSEHSVAKRELVCRPCLLLAGRCDRSSRLAPPDLPCGR